MRSILLLSIFVALPVTAQKPDGTSALSDMLSAERNFGISTGPWEAQEYRPNTKPLVTGYFITVWKNNPAPSTYASFLAKNARIQSETGYLPITLKDSINVWLGKLMKTLTWKTEGNGVRNKVTKPLYIKADI